MRLIDADKALKIVESYGTTHGTSLGRHSGVADTIHYEIAKLPTIEAEPVRRGVWLDSGINGTVSCSLCKFTDFFAKQNRVMLFKYCPNCGAKMN